MLVYISLRDFLAGTRYKNNKVCPVNSKNSLDREECWIESLRKSYPYGLNERKRKADPASRMFIPSLFQGQYKDLPDAKITPVL